MSLLTTLTRRWQNLTTDAKPDPPRISIEDSTLPSNVVPQKIEQKSAPVTPEPNHVPRSTPDFQRQKSAAEPRSSNPRSFSFSGTSKKNSRPKSPRNEGKVKYKMPPNVINMNIINSSQIHVGSSKTYNYNVNQYNTEHTNTSSAGPTFKPYTKPMSDEVRALSSKTQEITLDDMFVIKNNIGHGWRDMARKLGYLDAQIQQFEENHKFKGVDQVIYQILLDWKQANTKDAQIGELVCIIWSVQEYECVEQLVLSHTTP